MLASLVEELSIVIWPLVIYGSWFMVHDEWLMVEADGKQAEAHYPENYTRDVGRDECGTGREGSSAVHGQLYNAGELKPERVEKFRKLLEMTEQYRRKNQYE